MADESTIKLILALNDSNLDEEDLEEETQKLLNQMRQLDEVEEVNRVIDRNPPEGNKSFGGFLMGMLTAEVNPAKIKTVLGFLSNRLMGKSIELEVEFKGKKLKVKASNQQELEAVIQAARRFVEGN
ncbi:hypothetical protein [Aerosakkonema funiforme]|uniref:hypothetical protein n=1 Tax=Aerosakkonema funiforme TaxID=1246630 RepID=UPI0035B9377B